MPRKHKGGDRGRTVHQTRSVTRRISSHKKCVQRLFGVLEKLAGAKIKVDYLLEVIERAYRRPSTIDQWKALFNANKFRKSNVSVLKKELLDPLVEGSIVNLSKEAMQIVRQSGKLLENNVDSPNGARDIIKSLNIIFRENVDNAFINIQDDGSSGPDMLDKNIWQPEADILFPGEQEEMYDFIVIENSEILKQPPIKVKLQFSDNSGPRKQPRAGLTFLWNFLFEAASITNAVEAKEKLSELCSGFRFLGERRIVRIIKLLTSVYEKRFVALIPYLPAEMYRDAPDGPNYDDVAPLSPSWRPPLQQGLRCVTEGVDGVVDKECLLAWINAYIVDILSVELHELPVVWLAYDEDIAAAGISEEEYLHLVRRMKWVNKVKMALALDVDGSDDWQTDVIKLDDRINTLAMKLLDGDAMMAPAADNTCLQEERPEAIIECQVFKYLLDLKRQAEQGWS